MVAVTFGANRAASPAVNAKTGKKGKSFFARVFDAIAESQMKRAERQFARYRHLLPPNFKVNSHLWSRDKNEPRGGW